MQIQEMKRQARQTAHIVQAAARHVPLTYFCQLWTNYWDCIPVSDQPFILVTDTDICSACRDRDIAGLVFHSLKGTDKKFNGYLDKKDISIII